MLEGTKHHAWVHDATVLVWCFEIANDTWHRSRTVLFGFHLCSPGFMFLDASIRLMLRSHMMRALRAAERFCFFTNRFSWEVPIELGPFLFAFRRGGKVSLNHLMVSQGLMMHDDRWYAEPPMFPPMKGVTRPAWNLRPWFNQLSFRAQHFKFHRISCSLRLPAASC